MPVPVGPPPSKLGIVGLKRGSGRPAGDGDELRIRYFSLAYKGHRIYEDNWQQPSPSFVLGEGRRVKAWEDGLPGIRAGGRRELVVPGGSTTPGNDPEIYVVEAISVTQPKSPAGSAQSAKPVEKVTPTGTKPVMTVPPGPPPKKLVVRTLKEGSGGRVRRGERIGARFMDINYKTKHVQDFWEGGGSDTAPYVFVLGEGEVRKGWEIAIPGQRLGTRLELLLPSRLAYGEGPMRYVVELFERETTNR